MNFTYYCFFFCFLNVAPRQFKIIYVSLIFPVTVLIKINDNKLLELEESWAIFSDRQFT